MKVWPVLLDSKPDYLGSSSAEATLLGVPLGRTLLVSLLCEELAGVAAGPPTLVAPPGASSDYRTRLHGLVPGANVVHSARELNDVLQGVETSDLLLFVDPRCLPFGGWQLSSLLAAAVDTPRMARHLVAYAADLGGTREYVNVDDEGLVRSVHRYYKPASWPFIAGVAASLIPVSSGVLPLTAVPASLLELRELCVAHGVPSHDAAIDDGAFDLSDEDGMLAAMERSVRDVVDRDAGPARPSTVLVGAGHVIDPTARLLGPIVVQPGARIEARCTIVGPAIIGPGARISADAVLAQVSVGADAVVPAGRVLRDRTWFASAASSIDIAATTPDRQPASFARRLSRHGVDAAEAASPPEAGAKVPSRSYPAAKRLIDVTIAAVALLLLWPVMLLVAALVLARLTGTGVLPAYSRRRRRPPVRLPEVPHHAGGCRRPAAAAQATRQARRTAFQAGRRPAHHPRRAVAADGESRRAAAALQRARRRHESGRTAAVAVCREPDLRAVA